MNCPDDLKYTKEHEWAKVENENEVKIGITDYAQQELGDVTYVEISGAEGTEVTQGEAFGSIESVKAVSDLYSPVTGKIKEINPNLADQPELVNSDPYTEGWIVTVEVEDASQLDSLLDVASYSAYVEEESKD